jgi:hypothetical protein
MWDLIALDAFLLAATRYPRCVDMAALGGLQSSSFPAIPSGSDSPA